MTQDNRPKREALGTVNPAKPTLRILKAAELLDPANFRFRGLLYGRAGTGKTLLLGTLPRPTGIIDLGQGALTLAGEDDIYVAPIRVWEEDGRRQPKAWKLIDEAVREFSRNDEIKSIGADDLTALQDAAVTYVLASSNHLGQSPTQPEWGAAMAMIMEAINYCFAAGKHFVLTAHQEFKQEQGTGKGWMYPLVVGKLAYQITNPFDEVWHTQVDDVTDTQAGAQRRSSKRFRVMTQPDRIYTAKSRLAKFGIVAPVEDFTFEDLSNGIPPDGGISSILKRLADWAESKAKGGDR
jgi:hypothetical protein